MQPERLWHNCTPQAFPITVRAVSIRTELSLRVQHVLAPNSISSGLAACVERSTNANGGGPSSETGKHTIDCRHAKLLLPPPWSLLTTCWLSVSVGYLTSLCNLVGFSLVPIQPFSASQVLSCSISYHRQPRKYSTCYLVSS